MQKGIGHEESEAGSDLHYCGIIMRYLVYVTLLGIPTIRDAFGLHACIGRGTRAFLWIGLWVSIVFLGYCRHNVEEHRPSY